MGDLHGRCHLAEPRAPPRRVEVCCPLLLRGLCPVVCYDPPEKLLWGSVSPREARHTSALPFSRAVIPDWLPHTFREISDHMPILCRHLVPSVHTLSHSCWCHNVHCAFAMPKPMLGDDAFCGETLLVQGRGLATCLATSEPETGPALTSGAGNLLGLAPSQYCTIYAIQIQWETRQGILALP